MKPDMYPLNRPSTVFIVAGLAMVLLCLHPHPAQACSACANDTVQIKFPETAIGILKVIHEHDAALNAAVRSQQLKKAPGIVLVIRLYAKQLPAKASAANRGAVLEELEVFRKHASQLLRAVVLEDRPGVSPALTKYDTSIKAFDALFNYKN